MKDKSHYYNKLKFFSTILVVFAHASRMYTGDGVVTPINSSPLLELITRAIYSFHMPLFISISGMVYGYSVDELNKYNDSLMFLKKKAIRLLCPYLFFGLCYVAPVMVAYNFTDYSYFDYCVHGILLVKNSRHLWYIIVLFEIFAVSTIFKSVLQNKKIYISMITVMVLFVVALFSYRLPGIFQVSNLAYFIFLLFRSSF